MTETIKPLFKYIGGKSWLKSSLRNSFSMILPNKNITHYCEPFTGGLGSFLNIYDLLLQHNIYHVHLSDINPTLISLYNYIKNEPQNFIDSFIILENEFFKLTNPSWKSINDKHQLKIILKNSEHYFNLIKSQFNLNKNSSDIHQCSKLLFLQKHSFNGIYRENSKGFYNTPFNWSGNHMLNTITPKVFQLHNLFNLFDISFSSSSFEYLSYNTNTLYYLDPPYINDNSQENKYNKNTFDVSKQLLLIQKIKNTNFVYSNYKSQLLLDEFNLINNCHITTINRQNLISPDSHSRNNIKTELLITHHL